MANKHNIPEDTLAHYDQLIEAVDGIEKKGKNNFYTSLNGHMFSFVAKEGYVAIRLPKEEKEVFEKEFGTKPAISYGAVMKEYVMIPDSLLKDTDKLKEYLIRSRQYIETLKPKPTKKK
ncbi:MAG: hypothetical protein ABJG47_13495 [Ekhidna sp.]